MDKVHKLMKGYELKDGGNFRRYCQRLISCLRMHEPKLIPILFSRDVVGDTMVHGDGIQVQETTEDDKQVQMTTLSFGGLSINLGQFEPEVKASEHGNEPKVPDDADLQATKKKNDIGNDMMAKIEFVIAFTVESNVLVAVRSNGGEAAKDAMKLWTRIVQHFRRETATQQLRAIQKFDSLKYNQGESMEVYKKRFLKTVDEVATYGVVKNERQQILKLIESLPNHLHTLKQIILGQLELSATKIEMVKVWNMLVDNKVALKIEAERYGRGQRSFAYMAEDDEKPRMPNCCWGCGKFGHRRKECRSKGKLTCDHCQGRGHIKKVCMQLHRPLAFRRSERPQEKSANNVSVQRDAKDMSDMNKNIFTYGVVIVESDVFFTNEKESKIDHTKGHSICIDSGASTHVMSKRLINDKKVIVVMSDRRESTTLITAGNGKITASRIVDIWLKQEKVALRNVVVIDIDMKHNLISMGALLDAHFMINVSVEAMTLECTLTGAVMYAKRTGGLFVLATSKENSSRNDGRKVTYTYVTEHERCGHLGKKSEKGVCPICAQAKPLARPHKATGKLYPYLPGEFLYADLIGPCAKDGWYVLVVVDRATRFTFCAIMQRKAETTEKLTTIVRYASRQTNNNRIVQSDKGGEFSSNAMRNFFRENGINHRYALTEQHQSMGSVERMNRTIQEITRAHLIQSGLNPDEFWRSALEAAVFVMNRTVSRHEDLTPHEKFYGRPHRGVPFVPYGCDAYVKQLERERQRSPRFAPRSVPGFIIGYESGGYRVKLVDERVVASRDVVIDEDSFKIASGYGNEVKYAEEEHLPEEKEVNIDVVNDDGSDESGSEGSGSDEENDPPPAQANGGEHDEEEDGGECEPQNVDTSTVPQLTYDPQPTRDGGGQERIEITEAKEAENEKPNDVRPPMRRSMRNRRIPERFRKAVDALDNNGRQTSFEEYSQSVCLAANGDPANYKQAIADPKWLESIESEKANMIKNNVMQVEEKIPEGAVILYPRWVFKTKNDGTRKTRLCVKDCFRNVPEDEKYSPVVAQASLRILLSIAIGNKWPIRQLDISAAYLNAPLKEELFLKLDGKTYRLNKAIYGIQTAGKAWYEYFAKVLNKAGYRANEAEPCMFMSKDNRSMLTIYVDDVIFAGGDREWKHLLEIISLHTQGHKSSDQITDILGLSISVDANDWIVKINAKTYIEKLLRSFALHEAKGRNRVLPEGTNLKSVELSEKAQSIYRPIVGALLYLSNCCRPDIAAAVGILSRFVDKCDDTHVKAAQWVLAYLSKTRDKQLICKHDGTTVLELSVDASFAGDQNTRKSTTGYLIRFAGCPILWRSKLQSMVALSTCESEYIALTEGIKDLMWLENVIRATGSVQNLSVMIRSDSNSAMDLAKCIKIPRRSKHIDTRYHFIKEYIKRPYVKMAYVPTEIHISDAFTKILPSSRMEKLLKEILIN